MWLLSTEDLSLRQLSERVLEIQPGAAKPQIRYGILSHRWEEDAEEPIFEDYRAGQPARVNKGILKIQQCRRIAQSHNLDLIWADTC